VAGAFAANQKVADFFTNPFVPNSEKLAALRSVAGEAGLSATTMGLFETMAENGRMNILTDIAEVYDRILKAEAGEIPCHVSSAIPLSAEQVKTIFQENILSPV